VEPRSLTIRIRLNRDRGGAAEINSSGVATGHRDGILMSLIQIRVDDERVQMFVGLPQHNAETALVDDHIPRGVPLDGFEQMLMRKRCCRRVQAQASLPGPRGQQLTATVGNACSPGAALTIAGSPSDVKPSHNHFVHNAQKMQYDGGWRAWRQA